jgi:8-oxo-dGTP pyrophosphatase MutT (NUDIX family)
VAISVSEDFVGWSEPKLILWGDEEDQRLGKKQIQQVLDEPDRRHPLVVHPEQFYTDVYNMPLFTYEDLYLGLPVIFHHSGEYKHSTGSNQDGILYPSLVASRDLCHWDRLSRQPFLSQSRLSDPHNYDHGMIAVTAPVRRGDELWFYYAGTRFTHLKRELIEEAGLRKSADEPLGAIFLARMRLDGFASLHAGPQSGSVLTVPLKVTGRKLYVNADAEHGELRIEVRDAENSDKLNGYALADDPSQDAAVPVCENAVCVPVRWRQKDDLSELLGQEVQLHFTLRSTHLYAFWFGD